jgi:drug/metabolite transporter (DMT)-like permease
MHLLIAFLVPLMGGLSIIIENLLSNKTFKHPITMVFYVSLSYALFLPLVLFYGTPSIPSGEVFICYVVLAFINIAYLYPYYLALKVIDTSIVSALFALGEITVPVMSYLWLGERLAFTQYIGFAIIVMSSVALSIKGNKIPKLHKAFFYMVFAAIIISFSKVMEKYALNNDDNWINVVVYPRLMSGILPFLFLLVAKWRRNIVKNFPPYKEKFRFFIGIELIEFLSAIAGIYALTAYSPVVITAVNSTEPIFVLAISFMLFYYLKMGLSEKISTQILLKKLFCFVLIILGVILVTVP